MWVEPFRNSQHVYCGATDVQYGASNPAETVEVGQILAGNEEQHVGEGDHGHETEDHEQYATEHSVPGFAEHGPQGDHEHCATAHALGDQVQVAPDYIRLIRESSTMQRLAVERIVERRHVRTRNHQTDARVVEPGEDFTHGGTLVLEEVEEGGTTQTTDGAEDVQEQGELRHVVLDLLRIRQYGSEHEPVA